MLARLISALVLLLVALLCCWVGPWPDQEAARLEATRTLVMTEVSR